MLHDVLLCGKGFNTAKYCTSHQRRHWIYFNQYTPEYATCRTYKCNMVLQEMGGEKLVTRFSVSPVQVQDTSVQVYQVPSVQENSRNRLS